MNHLSLADEVNSIEEEKLVVPTRQRTRHTRKSIRPEHFSTNALTLSISCFALLSFCSFSFLQRFLHSYMPSSCQRRFDSFTRTLLSTPYAPSPSITTQTHAIAMLYYNNAAKRLSGDAGKKHAGNNADLIGRRSTQCKAKASSPNGRGMLLHFLQYTSALS